MSDNTNRSHWPVGSMSPDYHLLYELYKTTLFSGLRTNGLRDLTLERLKAFSIICVVNSDTVVLSLYNMKTKVRLVGTDV